MASHAREQYVAIPSTESNDSSRVGATRLPWWVTRALPLVVLLAVAFGIHTLAGNSPHVATVNTDAAEMALYGMGDGTESTAPPESTKPPASCSAMVAGTIGMKGVGVEDFDKNPELSNAVAETIAETAGVPVSSVTITSTEETGEGAVVVNYSICVPGDMDANTVAKKMNDAEPDVFTEALNANFPNGVTVTVDSVTGHVSSGGEAVCEGHNYNEEQCSKKDCCQWDKDSCMSAVGEKSCEPVTSIRWSNDRGSSKCFDVTDGSTVNGNDIQLWECVEGNANQEFQCPGSHGGLFRWGAHPNECFAVDGGSAQNGNSLKLEKCDESNPDQQFTVIGEQIVWGEQVVKCLAVTANGNNIEIADCDRQSPNQAFSGCAATPCPTQAPVTSQAPVDPCATTLAPANPCATTQAPTNPCATTRATLLGRIQGAIR